MPLKFKNVIKFFEQNLEEIIRFYSITGGIPFYIVELDNKKTAIEVAKTGNIVHPVHPQYEALWVGLTASPQWLKERIEKRVNARFGKAVDEVRDGMELILGAPPLLALLRGEISKEQAQRTWVSREYQYAKRQLTWFKKQKGIHWFDIQDSSFSQQVEALVSEWYTSK